MEERVFNLLRQAETILARCVVWLVLAVALWYSQPDLRQSLAGRNRVEQPTWTITPESVGPDGKPITNIDTYLLHSGLVAAPRFRDTLRWWVGTWEGGGLYYYHYGNRPGTWVGNVTFYRPVPSLIFWAEWKLFGDREACYKAVGIAIHLLAVLAFVRLVSILFRRFRCPLPNVGALLSGLLFVTGLGLLSGQQEVLREVFVEWKNQPDSLCLLFFCLSLSAYLRWQDAQQRNTTQAENAEGANAATRVTPKSLTTRFRRGWQSVAPFVAYFLCCGSKEVGILLPLLVPFLEWDRLRAPDPAMRKRARTRLLPMLLALPLFLLFRTACLHTMTGYTYGTNGAWLWVLIRSLLGRVTEALTAKDPLSGGQGLLITSLACCFVLLPPRLQTLRCRSLLTLAAFALLCLLKSGQIASDDTGFMRQFIALLALLQEDTLRANLFLFLFAWATASTFRRQTIFGLFSYTWVLLALGPIVFSPSTMHRYYLMNAGFALLLGGGLTLGLAESFAPSPDRNEL